MSEKKYKVGITVGVFDLFHVGHLNLLERCKGMCDYLIVGVCQDDYVTQIKHKTPAYCDKDRMRILAALKCVDEVIPVTIVLPKVNLDFFMKANKVVHAC